MNTGKQINAMVVVLFLTLVAIGAYTIFDPFRSDDAVDEQTEIAADRGANTFALNCRLCHGDRGQGGINGGRLPSAAVLDRPGLRGIEDGIFVPALFGQTFDLITNTISCGRVGTPMPAWAEAQGGTLSEEQIRQLTVLITEGSWELAIEHADEIDAQATGHATVAMPGGSFGPGETQLLVSNAASFSRGQFIRIAINEEEEERLRVLPDQLLVERGVGGTEAVEHVSGTEVLRSDDEDASVRLSEPVDADTTALAISDPTQFEIGDTLMLGEEEVEVAGFATGIPTTGQFLVEDIGRTPDSFMVSGSENISVGLVIRFEGELMEVLTVTDDGDTGVALDAATAAGDSLLSFDDPVFLRGGYVVRAGDELIRIVGPLDRGLLLAETVGVAETTIAVNGTAGLPADRPIRMGNELLHVTEILEQATVTFDRGVDGTSAASHDAGVSIEALLEPVPGADDDAEPQFEATGQTVSVAVGASDETLEVSSISGLAINQTYRIGDELLRVVESTPARLRVERGVEDTDREPHARRTEIFDGNLLEVERGVSGTQTAAHADGAELFMTVLEVERQVEDSQLEAHNATAEIFLGNQLIVERGAFDTEPAEHENGSLILAFPEGPADPGRNEGACGQIAPEASGPTQAPVDGPTVDVSLFEFGIEPDTDSVVAGPINFALSNEGGTLHNFRVIATDLAADELPLDGNTVDVDQLDVVASSGTIIAGSSDNLGADLVPGSYVLICNIPIHYESGMSVAFEVR